LHIVLTEFARPRLFPRVPRPNTIRDITAEAFERHLNEHEPLAVLPGCATTANSRCWCAARRASMPAQRGVLERERELALVPPWHRRRVPRDRHVHASVLSSAPPILVGQVSGSNSNEEQE
jgi:hypothetical protein